jgi:hypothetical protein
MFAHFVAPVKQKNMNWRNLFFDWDFTNDGSKIRVLRYFASLACAGLGCRKEETEQNTRHEGLRQPRKRHSKDGPFRAKEGIAARP